MNGLLTMPGHRAWAKERNRDLQRRTLCGQALAEVARPGDILAIHSAGINSYYSRLETIDM